MASDGPRESHDVINRKASEASCYAMGTGDVDGDYLKLGNDAYQRKLLPMQRPMPSNSLEGGGLHDEDGDEHTNASDGCLSKATSHSSWNANDSREGSERGGDDEDTSEEDDGDELR